MPEYTPGPWESDDSGNVRGGQRLVANCGGYSSSRRHVEARAENMANAKLVAAAPTLVEACVAAEFVINRLIPSAEIGVVLRDAIAEAVVRARS